MEENENSFRELDIARRNFNADYGMQQALMWELLRDTTELPFPVTLDMQALNEQSFRVQHEICDIMLAEITQIGHHDKYPRSYDWEDLLPTLGPEEELLWVVTKSSRERIFHLYIGIKFNRDDLGNPESIVVREERFQILANSFSKCLFPESVLKRVPNFLGKDDGKDEDTVRDILRRIKSPQTESSASSRSIYAVLGMPSPKDLEVDRTIAERKDEVRQFLSLNDALEPHLNTDSSFAVVFTVSAASIEDVRMSFREKFNLRDTIKPFIERNMQHSETKTEGTGLSITPAHKTTSTATPKSRGIWPTVKRFFTKGEGVWLGKDDGGTYDGLTTKTVTEADEVRVETSHSDNSEANSYSYTVTRSDLKFADEHIERELKHLQQALGAGGYYATAIVYAERESIGESIAKTVRATLSGSHSYLAPLKVFKIDAPDFFQLDYNVPVSSVLNDMGMRPLVLNRDSACLALLLPDADLPGSVKLKKSVFYARPVEQKVSEESLRENVSFGRGAYYESGITDEMFELKGCEWTIPKNDLFSHTFIVGAPGSGKSQRAGYILNHIPGDIRLVVLETAKREYADILCREGKKVVRYTLGNSQKNPFRINPFFFEEGTSLKQHIAVLSDAIADLLPMEALIGPKLREAVERCYRRCGWDVETGRRFLTAREAPLPAYPDMLMFCSEVARICEDSLEDYGPEVKGNYTGALKNRASIFLDDIYRDIFAFGGNRAIDELFPPDADVVIEMEDMPPSEINMPAFIISIVLHRIRAYRFRQKEKGEDAYSINRFVIAIEEAHNVLSRKIEQSGGDERQSGKGGHLLNQVIRLLAEGRGLGLGLIVIDQAAHAIAPSVLADTNTKVILRLEDGEEVKTVGTSIGLPEKDWPDLQRLTTGEVVVKTKSAPVPIKLTKLPENRDGGLCLEPFAPLQVPYAIAEEFLEDMFAQGLFSRKDARLYAETFLHLTDNKTGERDLSAHVWGAFLLHNGLFETLDCHIDYILDGLATDRCSVVEYYATTFRSLMSEPEADVFIKFALGAHELDDAAIWGDDARDNPDGAWNNAVKDEIVCAGARKVIDVLKEDCNDDELNKTLDMFVESLTISTNQKKISELVNAFVSSMRTKELWLELCEHVYPIRHRKRQKEPAHTLAKRYGLN